MHSLFKTLHRTVTALCVSASLGAIANAQTLHYYVDAKSGNDANAGTRAAPFKTITKAVAGRNFDLVVHVLPGSYGPKTNGDFWDATAKKSKKIVLLDFKKLKIVGEDRARCILDFNGIDDQWNGLLSVTGAATDGVEITNLSFMNLGTAKAWGCGPVHTINRPRNVDIHGNLFIDTGSTFICWGGFNVAFHDNVIISTGTSPRNVAVRVRTQFGGAANGDLTYVYNNVFVNQHHGISYGSRNKAKQWICNNIIMNGNIGFPGSKTPPTHVVMENNIVWKCTTPFGYTAAKSNRIIDPLLMDVSKRDFRQKKGSPCFEAGYPVPAFGSIRNDWFGNARASDGDTNRVATPDIGIQELVDVELKVANWGLGKTAIFSTSSPTNLKAGGIFLFAFGKAGFLVDPYGSVGIDPGKLLFSASLSIPASIPLPLPKDPKLKGIQVYAQSFGLRGAAGGLAWKPSGTLDLSL